MQWLLKLFNRYQYDKYARCQVTDTSQFITSRINVHVFNVRPSFAWEENRVIIFVFVVVAQLAIDKADSMTYAIY